MLVQSVYNVFVFHGFVGLHNLVVVLWVIFINLFYGTMATTPTTTDNRKRIQTEAQQQLKVGKKMPKFGF